MVCQIPLSIAMYIYTQLFRRKTGCKLLAMSYHCQPVIIVSYHCQKCSSPLGQDIQLYIKTLIHSLFIEMFSYLYIFSFHVMISYQIDPEIISIGVILKIFHFDNMKIFLLSFFLLLSRKIHVEQNQLIDLANESVC